MSFYTIILMSACVTYITRITPGHIENRKQHTADLQLVALFPSHLVLVQLFGSQTQAGLDGIVYF